MPPRRALASECVGEPRSVSYGEARRGSSPVEQGIHKPLVAGSIPALATMHL